MQCFEHPLQRSSRAVYHVQCFVHLLQRSSHAVSCTPPAAVITCSVLNTFCITCSILPRWSSALYLQIGRGCKCLITKTTCSLVWSCRRRYFVDAMILSTVTTVKEMMKTTEGEEAVSTVNGCGNFPGQNNGGLSTLAPRQTQNQRSTKVFLCGCSLQINSTGVKRCEQN